VSIYNRRYYRFFLLFALFFFCIASSQLYNFIVFKPALLSERIAYQVKEKKVYKSSGRRSYSLVVNYKDKDHRVDITGKVYHAMDKGHIPYLYYVSHRDVVISRWSIERATRTAWVFYGMAILLVVVGYFNYGKKASKK